MITRPFAGEGIRVTVGTPEEDDVFLAALDDVRARRRRPDLRRPVPPDGGRNGGGRNGTGPRLV